MIDNEAIKKLCKLAKISITESEAEAQKIQLQKILGYFDQISAIDTNNVEPMVTPIELESHLRADEAQAEVSVDEILKNAPDKSGNLFKVPPVI